MSAKMFSEMIAVIADTYGHHPRIVLDYNRVRITATTHAAAGLTENDFFIAGAIDNCAT